jgi:hypothetical protein
MQDFLVGPGKNGSDRELAGGLLLNGQRWRSGWRECPVGSSRYWSICNGEYALRPCPAQSLEALLHPPERLVAVAFCQEFRRL